MQSLKSERGKEETREVRRRNIEWERDYHHSSLPISDRQMDR
jgi:hypothetical protein